jgi:nucleoside-diphosphate-sugar epimerase
LKVLIAGASGFIGSHLTKSFKENSAEIVFLASSKLKANSNANIFTLSEIDNHIHNGELEFDLVVNVIQRYSREESGVKPEDMRIANVEIPKKLAMFAMFCESEFWHFSSYLEHTQIETEYVKQKREISNWLESSSGRIRVKNFITGDTFGPLDNRDKVLNLIKASIRDDTRIELSSPNTGIRLLHVEDLISNAFRVNSFGKFCFLNPDVIYLREILGILLKYGITDLKVDWKNTTDNTIELEKTYANIKRKCTPFDLSLPFSTSQRILDFFSD